MVPAALINCMIFKSSFLSLWPTTLSTLSLCMMGSALPQCLSRMMCVESPTLEFGVCEISPLVPGLSGHAIGMDVGRLTHVQISDVHYVRPLPWKSWVWSANWQRIARVREHLIFELPKIMWWNDWSFLSIWPDFHLSKLTLLVT